MEIAGTPLIMLGLEDETGYTQMELPRVLDTILKACRDVLLPALVPFVLP